MHIKDSTLRLGDAPPGIRESGEHIVFRKNQAPRQVGRLILGRMSRMNRDDV
ncbi:MAG: hypothetical protein RLN88_08285 [Ekhidna sp.]|uniref:hypothetical protein n=1 Tax=Ekhidna sp. TaxID=2608089 RepID=UPI0032EF95F4